MALIEQDVELMAHSCKWSPFNKDLIAVSVCKNFGFIGRSSQRIYHRQGNQLELIASQEQTDAIYDCAWSESADHVLAYGMGDGPIHLWDIRSNTTLQTWSEHDAEVYSIQWNGLTPDYFVTASWDGTLKLWNAQYSQGSIRTFSTHHGAVNTCSIHPRYATLFASGGSDASIRIYDQNDTKDVLAWTGHSGEVLCIDWDKYNPDILYTGGVDKIIKVWDIRNISQPIKVLSGHEYGVKRICSSPHTPGVLVSSSYDMSVNIWDTNKNDTNVLIGKYDGHTEFVFGLDMSNHEKGLVASGGWDNKLAIWDINTISSQWIKQDSIQPTHTSSHSPISTMSEPEQKKQQLSEEQINKLQSFNALWMPAKTYNTDAIEKGDKEAAAVTNTDHEVKDNKIPLWMPAKNYNTDAIEKGDKEAKEAQEKDKQDNQ